MDFTNLINIFLPVFLCSVIAVFCGAILVISSSLFGIKEDERFAKIRDCLPGANCGACGYSGCDAYATALALGECAESTEITEGNLAL